MQETDETLVVGHRNSRSEDEGATRDMISNEPNVNTAKAQIDFDPFCLNSFLTFRYVVDANAEWKPGFRPRWPTAEADNDVDVTTSGELLEALRVLVNRAVERQPVGLLLGGGIDSAILAALLPRGTPAYTVRFQAEQPVDESPSAARYAKRCGLPHRVVTVTWEDYEERVDWLMRQKRSPLHPAEVALALAACVAKADGVEALLVGNGADTRFGGLDRLLSRDWTLEEFVQRYTFVEPSPVLAELHSMRDVFEEYVRGQTVDVSAFLRQVHDPGLRQAFENAVQAAGCVYVAPYESLALAGPLDLVRVRRGEPKYLLREIFTQLFPGLPLAKKVAFARPMDSWMQFWTGPTRPEFKRGIIAGSFSGEQKWLLYCLERFMTMVESE